MSNMVTSCIGDYKAEDFSSSNLSIILRYAGVSNVPGAPKINFGVVAKKMRQSGISLLPYNADQSAGFLFMLSDGDKAAVKLWSETLDTEHVMRVKNVYNELVREYEN